MSRQALSQRLESLPSDLFIKLFEQVIERLAAKKNKNEVAPMWVSVASSFNREGGLCLRKTRNYN
ncbi:hypothetical protein [Nostoc sp.]|uniref:hypothetical protein n=1 Tax=Nostoc sp. TaxID=1180 RepID=UPI002FF64F8C